MCCAFIPRSSSVSPFGPFASRRLGKTGKGGLGSSVGSSKVLGVSPGCTGASTCAGACQEHMVVVVVTIQTGADSVPRAPKLL